VAIELARRGRVTMGIDLDPTMLEAARAKAPELAWSAVDLSQPGLELGRRFSVVVLAGNVLIFVVPGTEGTVLANVARHLTPEGRLIAGYSLRPGGFGVEAHDELARAAGLELEDRWSTWDRVPFDDTSAYAVSVHRWA